MQIYHGSCHCGAIKYEIEADLSKVTRCTCSICTKKGILLVRVEPDKLRITEGEEHLKLYQFNEMVAEHKLLLFRNQLVRAGSALASARSAARAVHSIPLHGARRI